MADNQMEAGTNYGMVTKVHTVTASCPRSFDVLIAQRDGSVNGHPTYNYVGGGANPHTATTQITAVSQSGAAHQQPALAHLSVEAKSFIQQKQFGWPTKSGCLIIVPKTARYDITIITASGTYPLIVGATYTVISVGGGGSGGCGYIFTDSRYRVGGGGTSGGQKISTFTAAVSSAVATIGVGGAAVTGVDIVGKNGTQTKFQWGSVYLDGPIGKGGRKATGTTSPQAYNYWSDIVSDELEDDMKFSLGIPSNSYLPMFGAGGGGGICSSTSNTNTSRPGKAGGIFLMRHL